MACRRFFFFFFFLWGQSPRKTWRFRHFIGSRNQYLINEILLRICKNVAFYVTLFTDGFCQVLVNISSAGPIFDSSFDVIWPSLFRSLSKSSCCSLKDSKSGSYGILIMKSKVKGNMEIKHKNIPIWLKYISSSFSSYKK